MGTAKSNASNEIAITEVPEFYLENEFPLINESDGEEDEEEDEQQTGKEAEEEETPRMPGFFPKNYDLCKFLKLLFTIRYARIANAFLN